MVAWRCVQGPGMGGPLVSCAVVARMLSQVSSQLQHCTLASAAKWACIVQNGRGWPCCCCCCSCPTTVGVLHG